MGMMDWLWIFTTHGGDDATSILLHRHAPPENALVVDRYMISLSVSGSKAATNHFVREMTPG